MTFVVKWLIDATGARSKCGHGFLDQPWDFLIVGVASFARLEKCIGVLSGAPDHWLVRRQRTLTVGKDAVFIDQRLQILIAEQFNLGNFMRGAETIKEMKERHS